MIKNRYRAGRNKQGRIQGIKFHSRFSAWKTGHLVKAKKTQLFFSFFFSTSKTTEYSPSLKENPGLLTPLYQAPISIFIRKNLYVSSTSLQMLTLSWITHMDIQYNLLSRFKILKQKQTGERIMLIGKSCFLPNIFLAIITVFFPYFPYCTVYVKAKLL